MKTFRLPYYVQDGGDGSVSVHPCATFEEAEGKGEEGWGESSAGTVEIKIENNTLFFSKHEFVNGRYEKVWKEVSQ